MIAGGINVGGTRYHAAISARTADWQHALAPCVFAEVQNG